MIRTQSWFREYEWVLVLAVAVLLSGCNNQAITEIACSAKTDGTIYNGAFINESTAVAVGEIGTVRYSRDGGTTWKKGDNTSLCLFGLTILDDTTFFATGNGSSVRMTVDGGKTWTALANIPAARGKGLSFASKDTGWIWSKGALFETVNGGESLSPIPLPQGMVVIETALCQESGIGLVCGIDGRIYRTDSAGTSWEKLGSYIDYLETGFVRQKANDNQTTAIRMEGNNGALVSIGSVKGKSSLCIIYTVDGGKSWTQPALYFPKVPPLAVSFLPSMDISTFNLDTTISWYRVDFPQ
ncbi:MAG: hypothetical protein JW875_06820 [Spirochaetales bacterium]|nr:hypothetical protein [Spirochaetales bacterium]